MKQRFRSGGLAAWSVYHPIGVSMITLTVIIIGLFSFEQLGVNLLPQIIAPEVRVRITDPGVPANIMEDRITRQLEEQLSITEDATDVYSETSNGRSAIDLSFPLGTDIDSALRDASIRLDRAKRYLPDLDDPPTIYKRDPSQIPVVRLVISSETMNPIELRSWADYHFSKSFLNLPGVAAVEIGGGLVREIQIIPDQEKLANFGFSLQDFTRQIQLQNTDSPGGQIKTNYQEIATRTVGRFQSIDDIKLLPLRSGIEFENTGRFDDDPTRDTVRVGEVAKVIDGHSDQRIRLRLNKVPSIKLSIQKQPQANTVAVANEVKHRIDQLKKQNALPEGIDLAITADQSIFIKQSIRNAAIAAGSGAFLAMLVIYLFLGSIKRTLIIGTAIPIGILVTFIIMQISGLTLNIMTLGGLALGMGLLIDSTIVMLENITRHQSQGDTSNEDAIDATREVNSPIVASTSTNLSAILPFLFIGGMSGLLFQELIITISSAMLASLLVALTLVPALGAQVNYKTNKITIFSKLVNYIKVFYNKSADLFLKHSLPVLLIFSCLLGFAIHKIFNTQQIDFPQIDAGRVAILVIGDPGIQLNEMDAVVHTIEDMVLQHADVESSFSTIGGFLFGRSAYEKSHYSSIKIQLLPSDQRELSSQQWVDEFSKKIDALKLTGFKTYIFVQKTQGLHIMRGSDDVSIHIRGGDLETLRKLGDEAVDLLSSVDGLRNLAHSYEAGEEELNIRIDRQRAALLQVNAEEIGEALRIALDGEVVSDYIDGDNEFDIRVRLPHKDSYNPNALENLMIDYRYGNSIRLGDVASIRLAPTTGKILRSQQQRIVEITAAYDKQADQVAVLQKALEILSQLPLPADYILYDNDSNKTLEEGQRTGLMVLLLAIFLVFVVMAVQYESLINPLIIMLSIPFAAIGVALGLMVNPSMSLSMSVWLGMIMLTGIVVNNAIVLVEQIEIEREKTESIHQSIKHAAALRLRPILMTTLTTVFGLMPLAIGLGEGSEMLQPLAFVIVWGLSFSMLVSLVLVPSLYGLFHGKRIAHRQ